jgi:pSer/pThr/pTyr-binding forkhead associated (FHA) protein
MSYFLCVENWDGAEKRHLLRDGQALRIGRSPECEVQLASPNVSRLHCGVRQDGRDVVVYDIGSRCGIVVNGERIANKSALWPGDVIRVGSRRIRLELVPEDGPIGPS